MNGVKPGFSWMFLELSDAPREASLQDAPYVQAIFLREVSTIKQVFGAETRPKFVDVEPASNFHQVE